MEFTKEQLVYHAVWRQALAKGEVRITLKTVSDARRVRFGLYNSVRPFREGKLFDPDLQRAAQECSIRLEDTTLTVISKLNTDTMQSVLEAIGLDAEELATTQAAQAAQPALPADIQESMALTMKKLNETGGERQHLDYRELLGGRKGGGDGNVE